jgi:Flp pilus assembly pilin Flp
MRGFLQRMVGFFEREDGPTVIGYAVMLALVAAVCLSAIASPETRSSQDFATANTALVAGS